MCPDEGGGARRSVCVGAIALLALSASVTGAQAAHVSCGAPIDVDTTLDSDLLGCTANGVVIAASGVTLDLAGHTIAGSPLGLGVANAAGVSGVTVENGTVAGFRTAVAFQSGTGYVVRDMRTYGSHDGVLMSRVAGGLIERVDAADNDGSGIHTPVSRDITIRRSHVHDNEAGVGGVGLRASTITGNVIERNTFYGIRYGSATELTLKRNRIAGNGEFGIALEDGSTGNNVVRNRVSKTSGHGIFLADDSGANVVHRNWSNRNSGDGFAVMGPGATLMGNFAAHNGALGINAPAGAALRDATMRGATATHGSAWASPAGRRRTSSLEAARRRPYNRAASGGRSVVVAQEPSKLLGRVRFPSPALAEGGRVRGRRRRRGGERCACSCASRCGRLLVEAEPQLGLGASGTNSGILHTGFDSPPGELETRMILRSAQLRDPLLAALGVPVVRTGAVLRPRDEDQRQAAARLAENAAANGVEARMEDDGALFVPGEQVIDPVALTLGLAAAAERAGARIECGARVAGIREEGRAVGQRRGR